jgi:hypothetical protein
MTCSKIFRSGKPEWPTEVRRRIVYPEDGHAVAMLAVAINAAVKQACQP